MNMNSNSERAQRLSADRGPIAPIQLAHVVRRTTRFDELVDWVHSGKRPPSGALPVAP